MSHYLCQGNIAHILTDAIADAANTKFTCCSGICEAIFTATDMAS